MKKFLLTLVTGILVFGVAGLAEATPNITDGLVACYPFNGDANDESGNGNHGTVHGATLTEDRFGNPNSAYSFDGMNDYIQVVDNDILDLPNIKSVCAWLKVEQKPGNEYNTILHKSRGDTPTEDGYFVVIHQNGNLTMSAKDDQGNQSRFSGQYQYQYGEWAFVAFVLIDNTTHAYVNGGYVGLGDGELVSLSGNSLSLLIGVSRRPHSGLLPLSWAKGSIDDIRIYDRVLSSTEINSLYTSNQSCFFTKEQKLDSDWTVDPLSVFPGETISYKITMKNYFNAAINLMISDALSELVEYVAGTLEGEIVDTGTEVVLVDKDLFFGAGQSFDLETDEKLIISFQAKVFDNALIGSTITNKAMVTIDSEEMYSNTVEVEVVPEPATLLLLGTSLLGLFALARRSLKKKK